MRPDTNSNRAWQSGRDIAIPIFFSRSCRAGDMSQDRIAAGRARNPAPDARSRRQDPHSARRRLLTRRPEPALSAALRAGLLLDIRQVGRQRAIPPDFNRIGTQNFPGRVNAAIAAKKTAFTQARIMATVLVDCDTQHCNIIEAGNMSCRPPVGVANSGAGQLREVVPGRLECRLTPVNAGMSFICEEGQLDKPLNTFGPIRRCVGRLAVVLFFWGNYGGRPRNRTWRASPRGSYSPLPHLAACRPRPGVVAPDARA